MSDVAVLDPPRMVPDVESFRSLSGAARDQALMAVEREIRRLQALHAELIAAVDSSRSYRDDHHRTVTAWVQAVTNASRATAVAVVQRARMLTDLPVAATSAGSSSTPPAESSIWDAVPACSPGHPRSSPAGLRQPLHLARLHPPRQPHPHRPPLPLGHPARPHQPTQRRTRMRPHNRAKHNGRITVTRDHTGWHHHRPDDTEICPRGL
jgi:hypothetical protein